MVLPDIKSLMVPHKYHSPSLDSFVSEAVYKLAKNTVIEATIAGAVLAFSIVGVWHFLNKWYQRRKQQTSQNQQPNQKDK
jgi:hypothetical protein